MEKRKSPKRHKDRIESEHRLLEAAKKVFSEHGFAAATTRMIAQKSSVNLALITRYFKNKQGLFLAVISHAMQNSKEENLTYPQCENLRDETLAFAQNRFESHTSNLDFFRIVIGQFVTDRSIFQHFLNPITFRTYRTEFEKRVRHHLKKLGLSDPKEAEKFADRIETYTAAAVVFDIIIRGDTIPATLQNVRSFAEDYVRMVELGALHKATPKDTTKKKS